MSDSETRISEIIHNYRRAPEYIVDQATLYMHRRRLSRVFAHYELFKHTVDLPGKIVECGVYRGSTVMLWAKLIDIFCTGDTSKRVIGFDTFSGFIGLTEKDDCSSEMSERQAGGFDSGSAEAELRELISVFDQDRFAPEVPRVEIVKGNICETAPDYVRAHTDLRISLLHLDLDLYEPTMAALQAFYPIVVKGGVVLLDDFALDDWPGATRAVEEYFGKDMPSIRKFSFREGPGGYFLK